jgi:NAD(P)-dependent dehydrogenase (short-subunit alcohol dehydrogenase family)
VIVERLAGLGAGVVVNDVVAVDQAAGVLPDGVRYVRADTADEAEVERLLDASGLPDVVCCHVGVAK